MSAILLDGGIVHYEVLGRGRPIIFLHGWIGSWRYWIPALQSSSTNFRAYALDFWGFGDTVRETQRYTLDKQIALLEQFLHELGIGKVALIGHGLGALVGLHFTLRYPNIVDRIMAINAPINLEAVSPRLRTDSLTNLVDWLLEKTPEAEPARVDGVRADPLAITESFKDSEHFTLSGKLLSMNIACLMVHGQSDPAISLPPLDPNLIPSMIHTLPLEQTGHFPMLEDTARFNRLLTDFLALESGDTPRNLLLKEEWKRRVR